MSFSSESLCALLPVKNGAVYLNKLIPNILNMLASSDSFIVINDGSTDSTMNILQSFSAMDSRLLVINSPSIGLVSALNLGVAHTDKKWIARFDADDEYPSNRLHDQRKLLNSSVSAVFSDYRVISKSGMDLGLIPSAVFPAATLLSLISGQRTAHPSSIINRNSLVAVGGYLESEYPVEDLGLWLRLSEEGQLLSSPETLLSYRISNASISSQNRNQQQVKVAELLETFPNWKPTLMSALVELDSTISKYKEMNYGYHRIVLHLRDILKTARFIKVELDLNSIVKILSVKDMILLSFALVDILTKTLFRRIYRKTRI